MEVLSMSKFIQSNSITLSLFAITLLLSILVACNNTKSNVSAEQTKQTTYASNLLTGTVSQTYIITTVNDNTKWNDEYYGSSLNPNDNIFFTSDYIQSIGQLKTGDTIAATYDKVTDELLYVSKVNE